MPLVVPAGTIAGSFTLTGRLLMNDGETPIAGATVVVKPYTNPMPDPAANKVYLGDVILETDGNGEFSTPLVVLPDVYYTVLSGDNRTHINVGPFAAPSDGATVDLADIITLVPSPILPLDATALRAEFASEDTAIRSEFASGDTAIRSEFAAQDTLIRASLHTVAPTGTASANVTTLQAAFAAAATDAAILLVRGAFSVNNYVDIPTGMVVDLSGATITQTADLTPIFRVDGTARVRIKGGTLQGKTTDYVNSSSVYGAAAVVVRTGSTDTVVDGVTMLGWAGAGVQVDAGAGDVTVRNCRMTGPTATYLTSIAFGFSAGVRMLATAGLLAVTGCDISQFAQGVTTADGVASVIVTGNKIHDIPSQHGAYFHTLTRLVFSGNHVWNTGVTGMKVQMDTTATAEAVDMVIQGNTFTNVGAQCILFTNVGGSGGTLPRRAAITGNVVDGCQTGIEANALSSGLVATNVIYNASVKGIYLNNLGAASVAHNRINTTTAQGIHLDTVTDVQVVNNRILNPGQGAVSTTQFGIHIVGVCLDILLDGNVITETVGSKMRYGIYSNPTSGQDTFAFRDNEISGGYDYSIRFGSASAVRDFAGNDLATGAAGRVLNPPTSGRGLRMREEFGSAAPASGAYLVGDRVWNTAPAASGTMGWVCTTAGSPGTWKTFGTIAA